MESYSPGLLGVTGYLVHNGSGKSIGSVIPALAAFQIAGAQARLFQYLTDFVWDSPPTAAEAGAPLCRSPRPVAAPGVDILVPAPEGSYHAEATSAQHCLRSL